MVTYIYLCRRVPQVQNPSITPIVPPVKQTIQSLPSSPKLPSSKLLSPPSRLGAKPISPTSFNSSAFSPPSQPSNIGSSPFMQPMQPQSTSGYGQSSGRTPSLQQQIQKPNYDISLPTTSPMAPMVPSPPASNFSGSFGASASPPPFANPPTLGSILAPSKPLQPSWNANKKTNNDWGDFDPLA